MRLPVDLGCGGGRNAAEPLRRYPTAQVTAIDYAPLSVERTGAYNRAQIDAGRCVVRQRDVSALGLPDASFDLATAFETIYFWPGLESCFAEVRRILRPGGRLAIVREPDGTDEEGQKYSKIIEGMRCYTTSDIEGALHEAGFSESRALTTRASLGSW
ncbi:class I SAM-dependent methyltransferase [Olsenella sp. Marseille-P4559]|uniref:class I SAM-dependent methyltransferase n=1 Tax=Olsenella sp. Marseille-P4559 TaxID=2364795 RepID=UPI001A91F835|nr:class I SAM-dependent methyltransferase [Olsenella sp. Marseille-P4559]